MEREERVADLVKVLGALGAPAHYAARALGISPIEFNRDHGVAFQRAFETDPVPALVKYFGLSDE